MRSAGRPRLFSVPGDAMRALCADRFARPSCDAPSTHPSLTAYRSVDTHSADCSPLSLEFSCGARDRPVVCCGRPTCSDPVRLTDTPRCCLNPSARPCMNVAAARFALDLNRFSSNRLPCLNVLRLLRHHLHYSPVSLFQLAQFLHVADFQTGLFRQSLLAAFFGTMTGQSRCLASGVLFRGNVSISKRGWGQFENCRSPTKANNHA
jgi:hypothetical protein